MFGFASVILFNNLSFHLLFFYLKLHGLFSSFVLSNFGSYELYFIMSELALIVRCLSILTTSNMVKCCQRNYNIPICMLILILKYGKKCMLDEIMVFYSSMAIVIKLYIALKYLNMLCLPNRFFLFEE